MAATHTVIVGSGIIGVSTAYYLSLLALKENSDGDTQKTNCEHHIHLVDPAPVLFEHVASGKAGGFLARDWFSSSVAELGAFSFDLHKQLAEKFDGREKWGWSQSTVINLDVTGVGEKGSGNGLGEGWDWIHSGESRVTAAGSTEAENEAEEPTEYPPWLNNFAGAQPLAGRTSTAQLQALSRTF
jgi:glycine/D-amino acid oxidase-like deaminating enzyme